MSPGSRWPPRFRRTTWSSTLLCKPFVGRRAILDGNSEKIRSRHLPLRPRILADPRRGNKQSCNFADSVASGRQALLARAAVDRTASDKSPTIAVAGRLAQRTDDMQADDRVAADLADRLPCLL